MGIFIAAAIIILWVSHLYYTLIYVDISFTAPLVYMHIIIQTYLYTGLFITGHDAMHGTVSGKVILNRFIGRTAVFLFAALSYDRLVSNHKMHHKNPGTSADPDFYLNSQNFFIWWGAFMLRYLTVVQIIFMAIFYNILTIWITQLSLWIFWILPAVLSTLQLFYFGTYSPHRYPHLESMQPHNARTQNKNHLWAMLSCYFFGYHHEHHNSPGTPWWRLYRIK